MALDKGPSVANGRLARRLLVIAVAVAVAGLGLWRYTRPQPVSVARR